MPRRGDEVMVMVTSVGTVLETRSKASSVGRTSYRGCRRNRARASLESPSRRRRDGLAVAITIPLLSHYTPLSRTAQQLALAVKVKGRRQDQDHVPVGWRARPRRHDACYRVVEGELAMQAGHLGRAGR